LARTKEVIYREERNTSYKRFIKINPPSFEGEIDPTKAEVWAKEIELIFRVMRMPENQ